MSKRTEDTIDTISKQEKRIEELYEALKVKRGAFAEIFKVVDEMLNLVSAETGVDFYYSPYNRLKKKYSDIEKECTRYLRMEAKALPAILKVQYTEENTQEKALEMKRKIESLAVDYGLNLTVCDGKIGFVDQKRNKIVALWTPEYKLKKET